MRQLQQDLLLRPGSKCVGTRLQPDDVIDLPLQPDLSFIGQAAGKPKCHLHHLPVATRLDQNAY